MSAYGTLIELNMPLVTLPEKEGKKKKGKVRMYGHEAKSQ